MGPTGTPASASPSTSPTAPPTCPVAYSFEEKQCPSSSSLTESECRDAALALRFTFSKKKGKKAPGGCYLRLKKGQIVFNRKVKEGTNCKYGNRCVCRDHGA